MAILILAGRPSAAETLEEYSRDFGAYDPEKAPQMVAQCEAQGAKIREGKPTFEVATARLAAAAKRLRDSTAYETWLDRRAEEGRRAYLDAQKEFDRLSGICDSERIKNLGVEKDRLPACVQAENFRSKVLAPRRERWLAAKAEWDRFAPIHDSAVGAYASSEELLKFERARLGLNPGETVEQALERTEQRCARLRVWAALGASARQREQDDLYSKAAAALERCDFITVERLAAQMREGAQRGAIESSLRAVRAREAQTRALYESARTLVGQGNTLFRNGRVENARGQYEQALAQLNAARHNTQCPEHRATIDKAIATVQRNVQRTATPVPAAPRATPPPATQPPSADEQFCQNLYKRGLSENRDARALYQRGDRAGARARYQQALAIFGHGANNPRCANLRSQFAHAVQVVQNNLRIVGAAASSAAPSPPPGSADDDQYCRALFDRGRGLNVDANHERQRGDSAGASARYQQALAAFQQGAADPRCFKYRSDFGRAAQTVSNNLRLLGAAPPPPTTRPAAPTTPTGRGVVFAQPRYRGYRINNDGTVFAANKFCELNSYKRASRYEFETAPGPTISITLGTMSTAARPTFRLIECVR